MLEFLKNLRLKKEKSDAVANRIQLKVETDDNALLQHYVETCSVLGNCVEIVSEFTGTSARQYQYSPKSNPLDANQILEAVFTLLSRPLDYVIVSNTLDNYPVIGGDCLEDTIIYAPDTCQSLSALKNGRRSFCGKMLRLPGYHNTERNYSILEEFANVQLLLESYLVTGHKTCPPYHSFSGYVPRQKEKPMVFVLPIFMAVGGVERNTIEIMRALQSQYEFCVITMERHTKEQGSLNHQLNGLCVDYFDALTQLKAIYQPDVIWLCNNSPWLEQNMLKFREIFQEQRIVAQDVYDTQYGWIEYYHTEGIHSLDRYIAVNEKIKQVFIERYGLKENVIHVVYSAIDDSRIRSVMNQTWDRNQLCEKCGLHADKQHIALIGRMTEQKNPMRYLKMIQEVYQMYPEFEFLLVGDGVLSDQLDEYISVNHLQCVKRIKFVESTPELFQILDGLVLTSVYEGLAIVSIEAMCIGVPILSTDTGDLKLFLDKTGGGLIIDESKSDKENFEDWYHNWNQYLQNARSHSKEILDFFSAVNIAKQYDQLFRE